MRWSDSYQGGATPTTSYYVELLDQEGNVVQDDTTDVRNHVFSDVPAGTYSVRVTGSNAVGTASSFTQGGFVAVDAEVEVLPEITDNPRSVIVYPGVPVTFYIDGTNIDSVRWETYDADADEWVTYSDETSTTLNIAESPATPGEYLFRAVAINSVGEVTSEAVALNVIEAPQGLPVFSEGLDPVTQLWANQDINLEVTLEDAAETTIAWELRTADGDWQPIVGEVDSTLNLAAGLPVAYNGGQIRAAATNAAGTSYSVTTLDIDWQTTSPGAPQNVAVGDGKLTWEAPAENGGPGVESYTVLVLQGAEEIASAVIPADGPLEWAGLDALAPGDYTIFVVAGNSFETAASDPFSYTRQGSGGGGGTDGGNTGGGTDNSGNIDNGDSTGGSGTSDATGAPAGEKSDLARTGGEVPAGFGLAALLAGLAGIGLTLIGRKKKSTI